MGGEGVSGPRPANMSKSDPGEAGHGSKEAGDNIMQAEVPVSSG